MPASDVTVRSAAKEDFRSVAGLLKVMMGQQHRWHPTHFRPVVLGFTAAVFEGWLKRPTELHLVAELGGQVVGYAYAAVSTSISTPFVYPRHGVQIAALTVAREAQRRGVASLLLQHVEAWARDTKADYVILNVSPRNEQARAFYLVVGYEPFNEYRIKNL
jgi:ribosomal protein S18 acetylase RimI-like enzyme